MNLKGPPYPSWDRPARRNWTSSVAAVCLVLFALAVLIALAAKMF